MKRVFRIALAGNPNVGKSTVFNALTGMRQHTGNWTGKTVGSAKGTFSKGSDDFVITDLPGTYSLFPSSKEEEITRDYIYFGEYDTVICVADATNLERNLNLILQILEYTPNAVICVNLMDEAEKKHIAVDLDELSLQLCAEVRGTSARSKTGLDDLIEAVKLPKSEFSQKVIYDERIEKAVSELEEKCAEHFKNYPKRWLALRFLENESGFIKTFAENQGDKTDMDLLCDFAVKLRLDANLSEEDVRDLITQGLVAHAEKIAKACVKQWANDKNIDRRLDRIFTSKLSGIPIMLFLLCFIFWLTIFGANYPSQLLSELFFRVEDRLKCVFENAGMAQRLNSFLCEGVFKTVGWIVSVMLPPMAIFFPLFTLLEDFGYLPRVAFNLDRFFSKAGANGKQSLTMCMGLGCNACGVTGCRIIDSERERKIAVLTNSFVPCNGRFPTLIAIITMFFAKGASGSMRESVLCALFLLLLVVLSVGATLASSKILSATVLKGEKSHFALELPPYRAPQIGKVIVRSVFDRTVFVLLRALIAAVPAGAIIWLFANIHTSDGTILSSIAAILEPFASFFGLDGVILLAFILGFPANEIVFPIIIMAYTASGSLVDIAELSSLRELLCANGWTATTALCTMLFSLFHFPCATTCMTIFKETKSLKQTAAAIALPTLFGLMCCAIVSHISALFC